MINNTKVLSEMTISNFISDDQMEKYFCHNGVLMPDFFDKFVHEFFARYFPEDIEI